jgi:hypothetical protein
VSFSCVLLHSLFIFSGFYDEITKHEDLSIADQRYRMVIITISAHVRYSLSSLTRFRRTSLFDQDFTFGERHAHISRVANSVTESCHSMHIHPGPAGLPFNSVTVGYSTSVKVMGRDKFRCAKERSDRGCRCTYRDKNYDREVPLNISNSERDSVTYIVGVGSS